MCSRGGNDALCKVQRGVVAEPRGDGGAHGEPEPEDEVEHPRVDDLRDPARGVRREQAPLPLRPVGVLERAPHGVHLAAAAARGLAGTSFAAAHESCQLGLHALAATAAAAALLSNLGLAAEGLHLRLGDLQGVPAPAAPQRVTLPFRNTKMLFGAQGGGSGVGWARVAGGSHDCRANDRPDECSRRLDQGHARHRGARLLVGFANSGEGGGAGMTQS